MIILCVLVLTPASARDDEADAALIQSRLKLDFETPDRILTVAPITIEGEWAIAGWTQGDMGGRALLRRQNGAWLVWLCAGDAITSAGALRVIGMTDEAATRLAAGVIAAEARQPRARIAMFARFDGIVPMGSVAAQSKP